MCSTMPTVTRIALRALAAGVAVVALAACSGSDESGSARAGEAPALVTVGAANASALSVERTLATTAAGFSLDWSADGSLLAVADHDLVRLLDGRSLRPRPGLHAELADVRAVRFSPNRRLLASAGADGATSVWNLRSRQRVRVLGRGSGAAVLALAWSPNGRQLAAAGEDGVVRIWSLATGRLQAQFGRGGPVAALAWSTAADELAVGGPGGVAVVDPASGEAPETLVPLRSVAGTGGVNGLAWDSTGEFLAVAGEVASVRVWRREPPTQLAELALDASLARTVAFSPGRRLLAAGGSNGVVLVWNTATWRPVAELEAHGNAVWSLAWAPDGTRLATAGSDERLRIWRVR
jgi:WD40 repeat protein